MDGFLIASVVNEIRDKLLDGRVDKVLQPESDEIIWAIRAKGSNYKLRMTASASQPRAHLTGLSKENPFTPPMFCMIMRKHLTGGRIVKIIQPRFERIIEIHVESRNEMRDLSIKRCVIEIMGKHSNIILLDHNGKVLDAIKHISFDKSSARQILPGLIYVPPPGDKLNPLDMDKDKFLNLFPDEHFYNDKKTCQEIFMSFNGINPRVSADLCERVSVAADTRISQISDEQKNSLYCSFNTLMDTVRNGKFDNRLILDSKGNPIEISCIYMERYKNSPRKDFESPSEMIESFVTERDRLYRINQKTADLRKQVKAAVERCVKKADIHRRTIDEIKDRATQKVMGELLTANIYAFQKGMTYFTALNYYEEGSPEVTIPLQADLTPAENAQWYFKKYNKAKRTFAALQDQIKNNNKDLEYLLSVQNSIDSAVDESDIADIREELIESGFLKKNRGLNPGGSNSKSRKSKPLKYVSSDGFDIYVGKNNKQNDELTLRVAEPEDMWLHTKSIPGSHVIIRANGRAVSDTAITEAAILAAFFSKGKNSSQVPVDYTLKRYVKKPNGARPGMVIYENNKTAFITPGEEDVKRLQKT
ncbi:MAG: NFACT family protein [Clostridiales bacterium]|jgi:predicted ribosome quality control (RQC) complex YloA/Tae2 family protein|nr:NFACT family protein [Clostridiales bacterium]